MSDQILKYLDKRNEKHQAFLIAFSRQGRLISITSQHHNQPNAEAKLARMKIQNFPPNSVHIYEKTKQGTYERAELCNYTTPSN